MIGAVLRSRQGSALRSGAAPLPASVDGYHAGLAVTIVLLVAGLGVSYLVLRRVPRAVQVPVAVRAGEPGGAGKPVYGGKPARVS